MTATDALDLDAIRARAWNLRWLAPGYAGFGRIRSATVTGSDDLLALDRLIGVDVPALTDEVERLRKAAQIVVENRWYQRLAKADEWRERAEQAERERDALAASINQRAGTR